MAVRDKPNHFPDDYSPNNPSGTSFKVFNPEEWPGEGPPVVPRDEYGLIQITARYYADYGSTTSVGQGTLTDTSKSWSNNKWGPYGAGKNFYVQDANGFRHKIYSNNNNTLTIDPKYVPAEGEYYIIWDIDFAGFEVFETDDLFVPLPDQGADKETHFRTYRGGTEMAFTVLRPSNGWYYFVVRTYDFMGNRSTDTFKSRCRILVGEDVEGVGTEEDSSLFGTITNIGHSDGWVFLRDSSKTWADSSIQANRDSISLVIAGNNYHYNIALDNVGDKLWIKRGSLLGGPPYQSQFAGSNYRVVIGKTISTGGGGRRPPKEPEDETTGDGGDTFTKPDVWFKAGEII